MSVAFEDWHEIHDVGHRPHRHLHPSQSDLSLTQHLEMTEDDYRPLNWKEDAKKWLQEDAMETKKSCLRQDVFLEEIEREETAFSWNHHCKKRHSEQGWPREQHIGHDSPKSLSWKLAVDAWQLRVKDTLDHQRHYCRFEWRRAPENSSLCILLWNRRRVLGSLWLSHNREEPFSRLLFSHVLLSSLPPSSSSPISSFYLIHKFDRPLTDCANSSHLECAEERDASTQFWSSFVLCVVHERTPQRPERFLSSLPRVRETWFRGRCITKAVLDERRSNRTRDALEDRVLSLANRTKRGKKRHLRLHLLIQRIEWLKNGCHTILLHFFIFAVSLRKNV